MSPLSRTTLGPTLGTSIVPQEVLFRGRVSSIGQTLWQNIEGNAELSDFMSILDKAGYRQRLQGSQFYTVWAPLNGTFDAAAIAAHDSTWIAQRFINSHIANYNYQATGELNRRVHTLNEKSFGMSIVSPSRKRERSS